MTNILNDADLDGDGVQSFFYLYGMYVVNKSFNRLSSLGFKLKDCIDHLLVLTRDGLISQHTACLKQKLIMAFARAAERLLMPHKILVPQFAKGT